MVLVTKYDSNTRMPQMTPQKAKHLMNRAWHESYGVYSRHRSTHHTTERPHWDYWH